MSRPYWKARHLETRALLPAKLERGRAYFIDDEQIIIIDHGLGPVEYGGRPGPQGQAGEPIPSLQGQINELAQASLTLAKDIWDINQRRKADTDNLLRIITEALEYAQDSSSHSADAIYSILNHITRQDAKRDSEIAILANIVASLSPHPDTGNPDIPNANGKIINAADGSTYIIENYSFDGNTGIITLSAYDPLTASKLATLKQGDIIYTDATVYSVQDIARNGTSGSITLIAFPN